MKLHDIAIARSGDKGNRATLTVIALDTAQYPLIERLLSAERVRGHYTGVVQGRVDRYALPQLGAVHFVLHGALGGGVTRSLALDAHGKTLGAALLDLELDASDDPPAEPPPDRAQGPAQGQAQDPGPGAAPAA